MPSDLVLKIMNCGHRLALGITGGRLGWSAYGMPVIELTTSGRRSGHPHTTMLTSPYQEGSTIIAVASRGGDDNHPAWYLNLRDRPDVEVSLGGKPAQRMRAEIADPTSGPGCGRSSPPLTETTPATKARPSERYPWSSSTRSTADRRARIGWHPSNVG